ncbi:mucin-19 [Anopheles ziemanni]|uniref:mucin-19 n=1 Tax=Anopheles ziemanni TaxID=345580 RepID=UPI00265E8147|nr:mucin-19 [Anopheles ziemanni]
MFDQDRSTREGGSSRGLAAARPSTGESSDSPSFSGGSKSRLGLFAVGGGGLSRTLSTPPIAESTHIGNCSLGWNGASPGGQSKRRPTSPLQNNRSLFKSSGNLSSIGLGRSSLQVYADAQSPGLVNRLVRYYDADQSTVMNRSQSLSSVYNKPGQFPLVHLRKQELRYGANNAARRRGNLSTIRIAAPERSFLQQSKRSSILRTGSMFLSGVNNEASNDSLFGGRGGTVPGASKTTTSTTTTTTAGNESDAENRVITPCAELEATPTRSVLDALKEISRKRINNEELDADRIKKQCKELSELDAAGSGPPSSTAAVAIGTLGMATKRSREQAGSPSSPSEGGAVSAMDRAGNGTSIGGGDRQTLKKRFCTKNNDILSSLSSSTLIVNTPKRVALPRVERRFNMNQTPSVITPGTSMKYPMPTSSSTMLVGPTTPEKFSNMLLDSPSSTIRRKESSTNAGPKAMAPATTLPSTLMTTATGMAMIGEQREQPTRPKITLFNRPYDATVKNTSTVASDGEEDEHGEGGGKVQFVKPKDKSPQLSGSSSISSASSRDPLKKPSTSKLSVMLKCLNGDLDEDYEGEEDEVEEPGASTSASQPGLGFTFNSTTKDTVDAPAKEQNVAQPKQTETGKERPTETLSNAATAGTTPAATATSSGISALINSPIKDTGLGKISSVNETNSEKQAEGEKRNDPIPVVSPPQPGEAPIPIVFSIGASSPAKTTTAVSSTGFTSPTGGASTGSTATSGIVAPAATFSFGTTPVAAKKSDAPQTTTSANLISFSPAPAASGTTTFGSTFGAKPSSPVIQFGSVTTTQSTTQSTASSGSTFTFAGKAAASPTLASTTTTGAAPKVTSPTFTFGSGSTFSAFKTPTAPVSSTTPTKTTGVASPPSSGSLFAMPAPVPAAPGSTFTFGAKPAGGAIATTTAPGTLPSASSSSSVFGSVLGAGVPATTSSTTTGATLGTTFTFGGAATTAATTAAPAPTTAFTFGGAGATATNPPANAATSAPVSTTSSTFPAFGASASTAPAAAPFVFGGPKPSAVAGASTTAPTTTASSTTPASTNLFASAAAASSNTTATSNLFGGSSATGAPATGTNLFGGSASGSTSIFGAPAATNANQGPTSTAPGGGTTSSSSPFTFGAKPNTIAPLNGPSTNSTTGGSIFGAAAAAAQQPSSANQTTPGGLFTFGSGGAGTGSAPQVPTFGAPAASATTGTTGSNSSAAPFTFGAAASKPAQAAANAPAATAGGGIFGSIAGNNNSTNSSGNNNTGTVPAFGAGINGGATTGTFGGGAIFGSSATNSNPVAAGTGSGTSIFGSNTQTANGPQQNVPGQQASSGTGGLFTFGGAATNSSTGGNTFGSATNAAGASTTFGSLANNAASAGLTNGIGGNKPFTFGASATASPAQQQQQQQQAPAPAPVSGGFNFNLGSNAPNAAPKPFSFSAGNASTGNAVQSPPMFGSPASNQSSAAPFTFGASAANNNPTNNNNNNASNVASPGPFTFGQTQQQHQQQPQQQQQQQGTAFNFSAGNVAAVAPQPQQQQQQPPAFNFGAAAAQSPFGALTSPGAPPAFGGAPTFAAPVGGMPTFSIGTNSTPNGPPTGQRRIKFATRRVK